jgi:hypothetical protein
MDREREITRHTLRFGVQQPFVIVRSHYENIDLAAMSQGFVPGYNDNKLQWIKKTVSAPARALADEIESEVIRTNFS